jgi:SAM-dependent methyltransferase
LDHYRESNRKLWNDWAELHAKSDFYDVEGFKAGKSSFKPLELEELGDVRGKSLLHLQCHFGKDTLSWARLGAQVTGVDWSDKAIALARSLSEETNIPATFIESDIYQLPNVLSGQFDIDFTSNAELGWLHDIPAWGQVVGHFVKPGGTFYIAEFHPFMQVFDETDETEHPRAIYPYFQGQEPLKFDVQGSYALPASEYQGVEYGWNHTIGEIINSLIAAGLQIEFLHEFNYSGIRSFPAMTQGEDGLWRFPNEPNILPMLFSLKATKRSAED